MLVRQLQRDRAAYKDKGARRAELALGESSLLIKKR